MNVLELVKMMPMGNKVAICIGATDNIWDVSEVFKHYTCSTVTPPMVEKIDAVYCPEFGDAEPMVRLTIKK